MKKILYRIFGIFFLIGRILPFKENRVILLAPHPGGNHDSLSQVGESLVKEKKYDIINVNVPRSGIKNLITFFFFDSIRIARAGYIFLNDNFMPLADLKLNSKTVITQLWHGEGAFKKFGLLTSLPEETAKREKECSAKYTYITCTSKNIVNTYAEAFGVAADKIIPLGSPRLDYLLKEQNKDKIRNDFDIQYPECKGKKLVLYAPTFRDDKQKDKEILNHINQELFCENLGDDYSLLIKLHPRIHNAEIPNETTDVTGYDIALLTLICDILITDYSSVCMDFALLEKPCIFYAFDLDEYEDERSFCFGYEDYVPGPVAKTFEEVISFIHPDIDTAKSNAFKNFNFDFIDSENTKRILEKVMK